MTKIRLFPVISLVFFDSITVLVSTKNIALPMPKMNEKGHIFATQEDLFASLVAVVNNALQVLARASLCMVPRTLARAIVCLGYER